MTTSPDFLTVEDVEQLHREQLELFGGRDGVRDRHALESAVGTPASTFDGEYLHTSLFAMAAAYAFHIAENQPFVDETSARPSMPLSSSSGSTDGTWMTPTSCSMTR